MTLFKHPRGVAPLLLLVAVASATAHADPLPGSDLPDISQQADDHFRKGKEAVTAHDLPAAYEHYKRAWELKKSPDIVCNLGNVEAELSKWVDAANHLSECVRTFPPTGAPKGKVEATERYAQAKGIVGTLVIQANVKGAEIRVDGRVVGRAPLPGPVHVEPGARIVEASLAGYERAKADVTSTAGSSATVDLTLLGSASAAGASGHPKAWILGAGFGTAAAFLGAGITFMALSNDKASDRDGFFNELPSGDSWCSAGTRYASTCNQMEGARSDANTFRTLSIVGFGAAGVAGGLTAAYALWPRRRAETGTTTRARPMFGANTAGIQVLGSFQ